MSAPVASELAFDPSSLPVAQLESLRFKANQIIESIKALQLTIDFHPAAISSWPDILSKYNLLLSQTHNFSSSLTTPIQSGSTTNGAGLANGNGSGPKTSPFEKIALHPRLPVTDVQLDTEIIPLLRNQQTTDVLNLENETVRRLSEHMVTRGSVGVLNGVPVPPPPPHLHSSGSSTFGSAFSAPHLAHRKPEYEDVLQECEQIRADHDRRADRAVRAVLLLRDKFEWKTRVKVEVEEPEELNWDPMGRRMQMPSDAEEEGNDLEGEDGSSDEDEVEGHLVRDDAEPTPSGRDTDMG
ncbi:hypothetical protein EV361DRAFT_924768 [Lentinula raphanica]|uniref:Mediator complex subunit 8 n=1 Tax=Lentinula raphanica TaxID=153919 RepID=A0AA38P6K4_9AGAR|nr:hypothetical protein F5878DRAFT_623578 [Lentinula raphanica]KAJ3968675.1 hypothetical protein EV361DRAFT_924768 [Lentinula raphanica]